MPLPLFQAHLIRQRSNLTYELLDDPSSSSSNTNTNSSLLVGFGAYSEGLGDDLHKCLWSSMGQDRRLTAKEGMRQYARFFFGAEQVTEVIVIVI